MTLGEGFYFTYRHIRLFAECVPEGWGGKVYELNQHRWVGPEEWFHNSPEDAKQDARNMAEAYLSEPLPDFEWESNSGA